MACEGVKPVVAIYSTFLQRAYDQLIHDVALQKLPMVLALDRAGLVGADGATHAGAYDIAFVRCIPNMSLATPADERECRQLLTTAYEQDHPVCVRYPRGAGVGVEPLPDLSSLPFGKGEFVARALRRGLAKTAAPSHVSRSWHLAPCYTLRCRWPRRWTPRWRICAGPNPWMKRWCASWPASHDAIVTVEDGCIAGGAGAAVSEALAAAGISLPVLHLGLPDQFIEHGDPAKLMALQGLDAPGIERSIRQRFLNQQV